MKICPICFRDVDEGVSFHEYLFEEDIICGKCRHQFVENKKIYHFENLEIHAFYLYDDFLESLLFQYKEAKDIALKDVFLWKKKEEMKDIFRHHECVIMPSFIKKVEERTFHHLDCMLSCCEVSISHCLKKTKNFKQSSQRGKQRQSIENVIEIEEKPPSEFYLFDDVVTTGNTLKAAAQLLNKDKLTKAYVFSVHPHFVELCEKERL